MPSFIKEKIAERKAKQEGGRGQSEEAKGKAENIASRHKERAKGIAKSRGGAMKHPGPKEA